MSTIGSGFDLGWSGTGSAAELLEELLHLTVDGITATDPASRAAVTNIVAPAGTTLAIRAVPGEMSGVATDSANDAGSEVLPLGTVILPMSNFTTILAGLVLVVSKSAVKSSKLSELVSLEVVLTFRNGSGRLDDIVNQLLGLVDLVLGIRHDKAVKIFLLVAGVSGIRASFALLD